MKKKMVSKLTAFSVILAMLMQLCVVPAFAKETVIYERGVTTAWSDDDISDWTGTTAAITANGLELNSNSTCATTKTFTYTENALLTYDVDFYVEGSTGRESNYAYVKFGSGLRIGQNSKYNLYYSTNDGSSYNSEVLKSIGKSGGTTNIKVVINTKTNTLKSLSIDGTKVESASNITLSDMTYNSVSLGFNRAGSVNWTMDYAITSVKISEENVVSYAVTYDVNGTQTTEPVIDGSTISGDFFPDTTRLGYIFKGWSTDGSSEYDPDKTYLATEELTELAITSDITLTAVYQVDSSYIEGISTVSISGADSMTMGDDPDTAYENKYSVVIRLLQTLM